MRCFPMTNRLSELAPSALSAFGTKPAPPPAGFDFPATLRGSSTHFKVYYDPALGPGGQAIADAILSSCEADYNVISGYFGGITTSNLNVILHHPIVGAYHHGCAGTDIYCDAVTAPAVNVDRTRMLMVAELVEVFTAVQGRGWHCQSSNGEGLSRVLATDMYPAGLGGLASAAIWLNAPDRPDYVTKTDHTDQNEVSNGCSVLFLNYLHHELGHTWGSIVQAGELTLAETYRKLTGLADALTPFKSLLQNKYPEGTPCDLTTDNPFPIPPAPQKP